MSYELIETSVDDGSPIVLMQIAYTGNFWYYTSADRDMVQDGRTYKAVPSTTSDFENAQDTSKSDITLKFPRTADFLDNFRIQPPSEVVTVTLMMRHYLNDGFIVFWKGRVTNIEWLNDGFAQVTCESAFSSLKRRGLRRKFSSHCPHALYSLACGVNRGDYRLDTLLIDVTALRLFVQGAVGKKDNHYAGGYVTWQNNVNGNQERRMIRSSVGATGQLLLASLPIGISPGQEVSIYPGCDHTLNSTGCGKFNNVLNFGGTPYIPEKNPFGGTTLY